MDKRSRLWGYVQRFWTAGTPARNVATFPGISFLPEHVLPQDHDGRPCSSFSFADWKVNP